MDNTETANLNDNIETISQIKNKYLEDGVAKQIQTIISQTDYSDYTAYEKLKQFNFNEINVIRNYLGFTEQKSQKIKSINQSIYQHLREHLHNKTE